MFDSVEAGIIPVCVLSAMAAAAISYLRSTWGAIAASVVAAIAIGYGWFWAPQLFITRPNGDSLGGWDLVATVYWSLFAVPVAVVVVLMFRRHRRRREHAS